MGLRSLWNSLFENEPEQRVPVRIPYIDLQRGFQLFVPQLYYINDNPSRSELERAVPETALRYHAPTVFSSEKTEFLQTGTFVNENGSGVFFGECKVSEIEKPPKDLLYIFLCTLMHDENTETIRPAPHFLFLGEMYPRRTSTLAVLPLFIGHQVAQNSGIIIDPADQTRVSNALGVANQVLLSILAQVPVDMTKILADHQAVPVAQRENLFTQIAEARTLATLANDIVAFQQRRWGQPLTAAAHVPT